MAIMSTSPTLKAADLSFISSVPNIICGINPVLGFVFAFRPVLDLFTLFHDPAKSCRTIRVYIWDDVKTLNDSYLQSYLLISIGVTEFKFQHTSLIMDIFTAFNSRVQNLRMLSTDVEHRIRSWT
jgi:hypothetical protein